MLHVNTLSGVDLSRVVADATSTTSPLATVLGVLSLLLVIPAAFFYVLIMFVREAALIILVATAPISAAGLVSDAEQGVVLEVAALVHRLPADLTDRRAGARHRRAISDGVVIRRERRPDRRAAVGDGGRRLHHDRDRGLLPAGAVPAAGVRRPRHRLGAALRQSWSDAGGMSG